MKYLRRLIALFSNIFSNTDSLPGIVAPEERITRYIFTKNYWSKNGIKPGAFFPSPKHHNTSVYRTNNCDDQKIWWLGDKFVTELRPDKKPILARADVRAENIFNLKLHIEPEDPPHPRHANISKWPDDKINQKAIAQELAVKASLLFHPNSPF